MTHPIYRPFPALLLALAIAFSGTTVRAQDAKQVVSKQKELAAANLKKADLTRTVVIETEHFFVATTWPQEKAKALGAVLERIVPIARKALQYETKEEAWKGKLTVYVLPEGRDFKSFIRNVVVAQPEGVHYDVRSDSPFVVDPVQATAKGTEAEEFANTAAIVASAYLKARGSTANVPEWLREGFARVTVLRADGPTSKRYQTYKAQAKAVASGAKTSKPAAVADLWTELKPANAEVVAASFSEYLAYGPGAPSFVKLLCGFRPDENGNSVTVAQAFEAAGWKEIPALEKAWQKWAVTGK